MNIQSVGQADSYAQFVKLVQEARSRNQGVVAGAASVSRPAKSVRISAPQAYRAAPPARASGIEGTPTVPKATTKTLGSFFDTYA